MSSGSFYLGQVKRRSENYKVYLTFPTCSVTSLIHFDRRIAWKIVQSVAVAAGRRKVIRPVPMIEKVKGERTCGNSNPAFVFGPEPGCTLTSVLRTSVRICLVRPASSRWNAYLMILIAP